MTGPIPSDDEGRRKSDDDARLALILTRDIDPKLLRSNAHCFTCFLTIPNLYDGKLVMNQRIIKITNNNADAETTNKKCGFHILITSAIDTPGLSLI